ncbi:MAG: outer membrane protein assembly factor BamD [Ramlibacter sp.]|jgi:outer membrane protein assembly factor BamD|uniref:outer membrane protein assembly factor BamD n=1 Tax=Ramlibacter sp. TaxID=1917967 RepID=UPI00262B7D65|nr:outer membrane protein assembly factor BamD [Ramlibacter sp.]MDH4376459.1 outer membrane protein assembly factor BamD [Ramlibacter sp.]
MLRAKLSTLRLACAVGTLALVAGCSTLKDDPTTQWSNEKLYAEARDEASNNAFDKAISYFEKLEGRAAGTPLAQQAQLEKAFTQFKSNEPAQALATLDRFMRLHPASPAYDYALYLKSLVNFNENVGLLALVGRQDLSERDQKAAKESFEALKELVDRFPNSKYAPDAKARMAYIVNSLAQYEIHVARYYFSRGAHVAAISRAQQALVDYEGSPAQEEALYILYRAYDALGMKDLASDSRRILQKNYPNSDLMRSGFQKEGSPWWKLW